MTITRGSRIFFHLYYRLLEFVDSKQAMRIVEALSHTTIIDLYKDRAVDMIIDEVQKCYESLTKLHKKSSEGDISADVVSFIVAGINCSNYDVGSFLREGLDATGDV